MAFLDEAGLQHYTNKIQSELNKKQNTTFPDGSPDIRIKEIGLEDYNALSEEKKNLPILYIIDVGDSENDATASIVTSGIATLEDAIIVEHSPDSFQSSFAITYTK